MQIFIVDSINGTIYNDDIELSFIENKRKGYNQKYKRSMADGMNPLINVIKALNYSLQLFDSYFNEILLDSIELKENKLNVITIYVRLGILKFAYQGDHKKPVEYEAKVVKKPKGYSTSIQKCNEKANYGSGIYYIEINTIPKYMANVGLFYEMIYEIQINKPGFLKILAKKGISEIRIFHLSGDNWKEIDFVNLNNPTTFPLKLLPYQYKITWKKNGLLNEKYIKINSNETTLLKNF